RLWRTLHKGQTWTGELQNRRKDGKLIWERTRIVPVKAADGSMQAYVGLKLDLTAPKAAEDRLAKSEQKFGAILENLPCVVYQVQVNATDRSLHFHYVNGRVGIYGLSAEDVLHNPQILIERTHPEDRERLVANALDVERRMEPSRSVFRVHRTDGKLLWLMTHNIPSRLPDGSILWTGYATDITAQREAEEQLRASEEKFRTLVETANDIIYTLDSSGRVDYVSPNWTTILGHPVGAITGRDFDELLHPDDLASARAFLHGIVTAGRKQASAEYRVRHLDGTWIWHTANGAPLHDAEGKTVGMFGIARDISERKQSEARILHMAHYDALTDLPNRSLISDRLEQALQLAARRQHKLALMFVDLDRFKLINDTHGHAVGDRVLQQAAQRMSEALRGSDAVGRIGGDEFVVLLSEIEDVHTALDVAVKISNAISAPVKLADLELLVSCSIGVAVYPDHGKDAPELFRHADLAMYRGKEGGRATIRLHGHNAGREPVTLRGISTAV
ncbi:MAG TPA: diguanylate cyclase, partial [Pseudomonadales bacterium]|nr:diguanylate cyclase [Pseudomonadales bacterium]